MVLGSSPSRSPRSRRRTASASTVTCAGSSCWWSALLHAGPDDAGGQDAGAR